MFELGARAAAQRVAQRQKRCNGQDFVCFCCAAQERQVPRERDEAWSGERQGGQAEGAAGMPPARALVFARWLLRLCLCVCVCLVSATRD